MVFCIENESLDLFSLDLFSLESLDLSPAMFYDLSPQLTGMLSEWIKHVCMYATGKQS